MPSHLEGAGDNPVTPQPGGVLPANLTVQAGELKALVIAPMFELAGD
jgi:hypothetical protein